MPYSACVTTDWDAIEREARAALPDLPGLRIDVGRAREFAAALAAGRFAAEQNCLPSDPEPAGPGEVDDVSLMDESDRDRYRAAGREALAAGRVAVAVLNGGMATRFGGAVKGVVEALGSRSFLQIKQGQAARAGALPFLAMNSFATHDATLRHLREVGLAAAECFLQGVSLRLTPGGEIFRDADGRLSPYAPGHGDFPQALRESGLLADLERRGVRAVLLSNVDNLGAEPDPLVIGYHLALGRPLTCEVAPVAPGDVGGTPARVDGRVQVVEGFRFSRDFDFSRLHYLSTNTFVISTDVLERDWPLTWFRVEKRVDGRTAVQMERLVNELSSFVDTGFLATPRGPDGRFFPIKTPGDLADLRSDPALVERFGAV